MGDTGKQHAAVRAAGDVQVALLLQRKRLILVINPFQVTDDVEVIIIPEGLPGVHKLHGEVMTLEFAAPADAPQLAVCNGEVQLIRRGIKKMEVLHR